MSTTVEKLNIANLNCSDEFTELVFGSGDDMDTMEQQGEGLDPKIIVVIIIGSVLLFILLCLIVPCLIECRRCKNEREYTLSLSLKSLFPDFKGHCCCACFSAPEEDDDQYLGTSSLERQKAQAAGYA